MKETAMAKTTEDLPGFEQRLLSELRQVVNDHQLAPVRPAAQERARRPAPSSSHRWLLVPAAALAVLVAVVGPSIVLPGSSGSAAYALDVLANGELHVVLAPDFDESARLRAELDDAGVRVQPMTITAAPALVGTIEIIPLGEGGRSAAASKPDGLELGDGEFWIDPKRYEGSVEMLVYVAPPPGEPWQQAPSVFHPDQPLGGLPCSLEGPLTAAVLEGAARQSGIERFTWLSESGDPTKEEVRLDRSSERPDGEVASAMLRASGELEVMVRPAPLAERFGHLDRPSMSLNLHDADEPPCTPELAARWTDIVRN